MKKIISKTFIAIIFSTVIFQKPLLAQVKTNFTKEVRPSDSNPTGLVSPDYSSDHNKVDVKVPKRARGVERYDKLNIWGEVIPDSFLFHRSTLNQRQKAVYDVCYKALMKNEQNPVVPVEVTLDELREALFAVRHDNPEIFWWSGEFSYWDNSDGTPTSVSFVFCLDSSEFEKNYEKFWKATSPVLFYASTLPDEMSKIKYIHDYICLSTEYDYEALNTGNYGGKYQTAYSCAVDYKTVCAGYAALFQYYMQNLGIPCAKISSDTHAWNLLKVNGQCYQMDVTWDDAKKIPPFFNLTHEEMGKIDSHTPDAAAQKVIKANPSKGNKMSYLEYFGALVEGSPYTYEELNYYDYEKNTSTQDTVKIYKTEPEIYKTIKTPDELKSAIKKLNYSDGTVFSFYIPTEEAFNEILEQLRNGDICAWQKSHYANIGNGFIYDLTLAGSNTVSEDSTDDDTSNTNNTNNTDNTDTNNDQNNNEDTSSSVYSVYSVYVTLGGGTAEKAKKIAESVANVVSVTVNNLENGRFELVVSVKGDSELQPVLAKKLIQSGFDLYELSITQKKDDISANNNSTKNNDTSKNTNSQTSKNTEKKSSPKIGDKGPGGGIIFYIEGRTAYECSEIIGEGDWEEAKVLCKQYSGGGKSDWYLPTLEQLNQIYQNLRKTKKISNNECYWSSTPDKDKTLAMIQDFSDGEQWTNFKWIQNPVRAVRAFEY